MKLFPTWRMINYVSYGILNGFTKWQSMGYLSDNPKMLDALQEIALVNAQKLPSLNGATTEDSDLTEAVKKYSDLLSAQLSLLNPDVFIAGSTLWLYKDIFELKQEGWKNNGGCVDYWEQNGKLYIDAYHPAQTTVTPEKYCDDIISLIETWYNNKQVFLAVIITHQLVKNQTLTNLKNK